MPQLPYIIPYEPAFLGGGFLVPFPTLNGRFAGRALNGGQPLHYIHFSIVMDRTRRTAIYTACNVDGNRMIGVDRGEWDLDPRAGEFQIGNEAYRNNDWDKGHLVRRQDVAWGDRRRDAKIASDATFHYTNAALQHHNFNGDEWLQLEDWVLQRATRVSRKLCVLTGPILTEQDPMVAVNPGIEVQVPSAFWKLIVLRDPSADGDDLSAVAFIIPQTREFIATVAGDPSIPRWDDNQLRVYQVGIDDLETMSGIGFGELRNADDFDWSHVRRRSVSPWENWQDNWKVVENKEDIVLGGDTRRSGRGRMVPRTYMSGHLGAEWGAGKKVELRNGFRTGESGTASGCANCDPTASIEILARKVEMLTEALEEFAHPRPEGGEEGELAAEQGTDTNVKSMLTILDSVERKRADRLRAQLRRIRGGTPIAAREYPSCVVLGDEQTFYCTGIIIGPKTILTAGHCDVWDLKRALIGAASVAEEDDEDAQLIRVVHAVQHPEYSERLLPRHDVALVFLEEAIRFGNRAQPVASIAEADFASIDAVQIAGYGNTNAAGSEGFGRKRKATVNIHSLGGLSLSEIREEEREYGFGATHEFFARSEGLSIDTCDGDSGGPAYITSETGVDLLVGMTSRLRRRGAERCGPGGIYTKIYPYAAWIAESRATFEREV